MLPEIPSPTTGAPTIRASFTPAGALASLTADDLSLVQYPASEHEAGPHQVWLRVRRDDGTDPLPLTGPACGGRIRRSDDGVMLAGDHGGVAWTLTWRQPAPGVFGWVVGLVNRGADPVVVDAVWTVDAALTELDALQRSENYVAQYLDVTPLTDAEGFALAVRQNMPGAVHPWLAVVASVPVVGWCTDALQLRGAVPGTGLDLTRDLPAERLQHEHTLLGLQTEPVTLAPGEATTLCFGGLAVADHPERSSDADLPAVRAALVDSLFVPPREAEPEAGGAGTDERDAPHALDTLDTPDPLDPLDTGEEPVGTTLFSPVTFAHGEDVPDGEFAAWTGGAELEADANGRPWAALSGRRHVVRGTKEHAVLRPHGHVQRVAAGPMPTDLTVASTAWMAGTFAAQVTVGHACAAPLVSVRRSYLGLTQAEGVRIFVRDGDDWRLLGVPSAWAVEDERCTWWYRWGGRLLVVRSELGLAGLTVSIEVAEGDPLDLRLFARASGGDVIRTEERATALTHTVAFDDEADHRDAPAETGAAWPTVTLASDDAGAQRLNRMLPWFTDNALVHYQAPRGLEQFTGGAWGTRDVCQGPVGLFVATGRWDVQRAVLLATFAAQQDDGDWPQWFQYLPEHAGPGYRESHGDVVYWPLLALGEYLMATGDGGILDEEVGWVADDALRPASSVRAHVEAALGHLAGERSADPRLPAYGHGDWNDALQPASPALARSLVSAWTATLEIKALRALADGLRAAGRASDPAVEQATVQASATADALRERLVVDGELCGYAVVSDDGLEPLVHPADTRTGLRHGSLQMIHALADELLTPEEASAHLAVIDEHLDGPTGIYLFDRPVEYHGGETHTFLRAEAASFWGREIGLMYMHAHIRWVEALLRLGLAERAWAALQLVLPEGLRAAVPGAVPMQSNCYHSSVDALFPDRYAAQDEAERLFDPTFGFAGGWRVYSSGSGLVLRLVTEGFLGVRVVADGVELDPVLPAALDGLLATVPLGDRVARVLYRVGEPGCGVRRVEVNGRVVFPADGIAPVERRYRAGGVRISREGWGAGDLAITIEVGAS
ncbi:hypothetical protein PCC79_01550 [Propioniciclava soli]|uniref:Cellobiose phosphorylase n=1 Tax=Propioniciclava soli TaxID=2775081 RepID=A0ABZ3C9P4_9ACTN